MAWVSPWFGFLVSIWFANLIPAKQISNCLRRQTLILVTFFEVFCLIMLDDLFEQRPFLRTQLHLLLLRHSPMSLICDKLYLLDSNLCLEEGRTAWNRIGR